MLRIGLLGCDATIAGVARAAVRRGDRLVAGHGVHAAALAGLAPPPVNSWEAMLDADTCDAVLVGADGWDDGRREAVKTLVQAGRPLVLSQPLELSMLWAYELDMIRRDTGGVLIPCLAARQHPFVARLRTAVEAAVGGTGTAESLHVERRLRDRSREAVLAHLARDVDLIRVIVGDPARLATLGAADAAAAWPSLAVGFSGPALVPARWQVAPAGTAGLTIRLQGAADGVVVEAPENPDAQWSWNGTPADGGPFDPAHPILAALDAAIGTGSPDPATGAVPAATWSDAARAIELAETVPRSLAKGRAIELHREEFTDLGTFRGTMASLGCGLIMLALVVVILATFVAGIAREFGWNGAGMIADSWPGIVLAVLGVFLALQAIPLLMGGDGDPPGSGGDAGQT
ncbi:MAG: hypothetical protein ACKO4Z_14295 [Planctomycetota bacterium]